MKTKYIAAVGLLSMAATVLACYDTNSDGICQTAGWISPPTSPPDCPQNQWGVKIKVSCYFDQVQPSETTGRYATVPSWRFCDATRTSYTSTLQCVEVTHDFHYPDLEDFYCEGTKPDETSYTCAPGS